MEIALRVAQLGIELKTPEVRVGNLSDDRGMYTVDIVFGAQPAPE